MTALPDSSAAYVPIDWEPLRAPAARIGCSIRHLQREVEAGRLRAVPIDSRGTLRTCPQWIDAWLLAGGAPSGTKKKQPRRKGSHNTESV